MTEEKKQLMAVTDQALKTELPEKRLARYAWFLGICWTLFIFGFLALDILDHRHDTESLAVREARANFDKDQAFRYWAASHGGVYVPVTEKTRPNPYLKDLPERDIRTPSGKLLTLMNPAYMVREMNERFRDLYGIRGHITSLNLHRAENAPDEWERKALKAFEREEKEVLEFSEIDGKPYIRLMQPMITVEGCLKCHAYQGYKVGDVRGGVSVSVPLSDLYAHEWEETLSDLITHGAIWIVGLIAIVTGQRRFKGQLRERERANKALIKWGEIFKYAEWGIAIGSGDSNQVEMMNRAFAEMHGWTMEEMRGRSLLDIYAPPCHKDLPGYIQKVHDFGHYTFESIHIRKDGSTFPVLMDVTAIKDDDGEVLYRIANVQDISAMKESEKKMKEQLDELRRWSGLNLDREERIMELKEEVNRLLEELGKDIRYMRIKEEENQ
ncbi:MAG: DUF3365 domain-containing protein [Deltaproteobacteria bacterium]|nr:DUF3365 domain-containing protein [Deltaproteobacteria bacterium]